MNQFVVLQHNRRDAQVSLVIGPYDRETADQMRDQFDRVQLASPNPMYFYSTREVIRVDP